MSDRPKPIIIKKVNKKHEGHHGGSWKVAYADFVTAMMAFFLLMWLLAMVSPEKRAQLSLYFNNFSVWKESGASFSSGGGYLIKADGVPQMRNKGAGAASALKKKLKQAVEEKMKSAENQIIIDVIDGGVRIQIVDTEGSMMFPLGSSQPTDKAVGILKLVAENIEELPNKVAIEGHTDSVPYRGDQITNWELSTSRASAARRELEKNGIEPGRIARVVGYADQELYIKDNPRDLRNRRISIIVLPVAQKEQPFSAETGINKVIPNQIPQIQTIVPPQSVQPGTVTGQPTAPAAAPAPR